MPSASARSEYSGPWTSSMSVSDRTTSVEERCTMVTSAPLSQSAAAMSWAELLEPMTTAFRPR
jgi:hypothetical protein